MAFLRHLAQIAMSPVLDENQLGVGNFFREHLRRLDVAAGAAFMDVLVADDDQSRRFNFVNKMRGFVALPRHHVTQIAFERRYLVDDQLLVFFHHVRVILHETLAEHESRSPMIALILLVAFLDHF